MSRREVVMLSGDYRVSRARPCRTDPNGAYQVRLRLRTPRHGRSHFPLGATMSSSASVLNNNEETVSVGSLKLSAPTATMLNPFSPRFLIWGLCEISRIDRSAAGGGV